MTPALERIGLPLRACAGRHPTTLNKSGHSQTRLTPAKNVVIIVVCIKSNVPIRGCLFNRHRYFAAN